MCAFFGEPYYSNGPFGYVSPYEHERRRIAEENRRRYYAEQQYRRQLEERRRRAAALDYQRHLAREQALRRQQELDRLSDEAEESDRYYIVRGPDGGLYRVPASRIINNQKQRESDHESALKSELREPKHCDEELGQQLPIPSAEETHHTMSEMEEAPSPIETEETCSHHMKCDSSVGKDSLDGFQRYASTKTDVVVEDASDDEEEKELKSIWRNRRPSPGILMEPVESF